MIIDQFQMLSRTGQLQNPRFTKDFYFTKEEEVLIIRLVSENEEILFGPSSEDVKSPREAKKAIWQKIADEINQQNPKIQRTGPEIAQKWRNIKRTLLAPSGTDDRIPSPISRPKRKIIKTSPMGRWL